MIYSPLRYPGGKNRLSKFIAKVCLDNDIHGHYIEPYAGGAAVALYLLLENKVGKITINDFDKSIYAFWYAILNHTDEFCKLIRDTELSYNQWIKQKAIQRNKKNYNLLALGFSTFYLNRTNRSGIICAGLIGGVKQNGIYKMYCRFNKQELINRIIKIAKYKNKIHLFNKDALDLIKKIKSAYNNRNTIIYFDPPYYLKGATLYKNSYKDDDHKKVATLIKTIKGANWIISYDNTQEIKSIYGWVKNKYEYILSHSAYKMKKGKEILFFSDNLGVIDFKIIPTYKIKV